MTNAYDNAKAFSEDKLALLRCSVKAASPSNVTVITSGSYARREASDQSDIDYFAVLPGEGPEEDPPHLHGFQIWIKRLQHWSQNPRQKTAHSSKLSIA